MLHINPGATSLGRTKDSANGGRSISLPRRGSRQIIDIEEEEEEEDGVKRDEDGEEFEEVEAFSPLGPDDIVETLLPDIDDRAEAG